MVRTVKIGVLLGVLLTLPGANCQCVAKIDEVVPHDPTYVVDSGTVTITQGITYSWIEGSLYEYRNAELYRRIPGMPGIDKLATIDFTDTEFPNWPGTGQCERECEPVFEFDPVPCQSGEVFYVVVNTVMDQSVTPWHPLPDDVHLKCPEIEIP